MQELINVVIKQPNKPPHRKTIKNTLEAFQKIVGGYIETFPIAVGIIGVVNEDGIALGLPRNCEFFGHRIYGTLILCGVDGEDFASLPYSIDLDEEGGND